MKQTKKIKLVSLLILQANEIKYQIALLKKADAETDVYAILKDVELQLKDIADKIKSIGEEIIRELPE